jgi:hypothetical protein
VRGVDGLAQQSLQPIPGGQDLRQAFLCDHAPGTVQRDTPLDLDAEIADAGAAAFERLQQLRVRGDTRATPNQLDRRALVDVGIPADLPQERGREQARQPVGTGRPGRCDPLASWGSCHRTKAADFRRSWAPNVAD